MFPIPDPSRLIPRPAPPSTYSGRRSRGEDLLALGGIPLVFVSAYLGGALGAAISPWLLIPAGIVGLSIALAIMEYTLVCGLVEAALYGTVAFFFSGGADSANPTPHLMFAGVVVVVFLWSTYSAWQFKRS